jgi:NAD(P)-dependent dehydrogenase (short-subunit alcohol dehydrogenase family)
MKIIVTGHTRGLGKGIYDYFSKDNEVVGFSKSNGFDITDSDCRTQIVNASEDADIFVNNAHANGDFAQLHLLKDMHELWKHQNKIIINVSSFRSTFVDGNFEFSESFRVKKELDLFCTKNQHVLKYPYIINLRPGLIDTDRTRNEQGKKINVQDVIMVLDFILKNKDTFKILDIGFKG